MGPLGAGIEVPHGREQSWAPCTGTGPGPAAVYESGRENAAHPPGTVATSQAACWELGRGHVWGQGSGLKLPHLLECGAQAKPLP